MKIEVNGNNILKNNSLGEGFKNFPEEQANDLFD